jgi:trk system potassium uptake protein TrkH
MENTLGTTEPPHRPNDLTESAPGLTGQYPRFSGIRVICRLMGMLLMVVGIFMASCLIWALYYDEPQAVRALGISVSLTLLSGLGLFMWGRLSRKTVYRREALAVVGLGWVLIGLYGALPYFFSGTIPNFVDAYFEATSGFTTTGATILEDIEAVPRGILFWRMLTQWLGGMGIIVLFTALFAQLGVGAKQLFRSETPGPITENLRPKIRETALAMWKIYSGLTVLLTGLLMICGMDFFDAICHGFTTMATGGYSTHNQSIGHYHSVAIELVILLFMFIGGVNFTLYYQVLQGQWRTLVRNSEFLTYLGICLVVTLIIALDIYGSVHADPFQALRYAFFQTATILTTTGFVTDDFNAYPSLSKMLLVCLMIGGGCAGSTAGGMKIWRLMVLIKIAYQGVYQVFRPQVRMSVRVGRAVVSPEIAQAILVFGFTYVFFFALGSVFMAMLGLDMVTAASTVIACLSNIGPGLAGVGPTQTYAHLPAIGKFYLTFCMLLGRLELSTLLVLLLPAFWKKIVQE